MMCFDRYVNVVLEEYRTLRDESKQTTTNMWTAMQWTSVIIAALFGVGLNQWNEYTPTSAIVFGLLLPWFCFLTMAFWLGEAVRLKRVGDYLFLLERKVEFLFQISDSTPDEMLSTWPRLQQREEIRLRVADAARDGRVVGSESPLAWETWLRLRRSPKGIHGHQSWLFAIRLGFFLIVSAGSYVLSWIWIDEHGSIVVPPLRMLITTFGVFALGATIIMACYWGLSLNSSFRMAIKRERRLRVQPTGPE